MADKRILRNFGDRFPVPTDFENFRGDNDFFRFIQISCIFCVRVESVNLTFLPELRDFQGRHSAKIKK